MKTARHVKKRDSIPSRGLVFMLLFGTGLFACDGGGEAGPPEITFTHHLLDVRALRLDEVPGPLLTGIDSRGTPVILGDYEIIDGDLVDRASEARPGQLLHPELCLEKDPMYPYGNFDGWPAVVLDGEDRRIVGMHIGRHLTAWRWWFDTRRDWTSSDLVTRDLGHAIPYGSSAAFVSEAGFPFFLVTDYFDQTTNTAKVTVSSIPSPADDGVEDLGTFDGMEPYLAWVPAEDMLYLAHRTLHEPCALRRWDGASWDQVVGPQISAGGACVGLAVSGDGALVMIARNLPTPATAELRAYRRAGNGWQDAGRIGPESDGQLLGIQVGPVGDGLVVSHTDPDAGVAFWTWDGASTWNHLATIGAPGLTRVSWTAGPDRDLFLAFLDQAAEGFPRLMRLPLDGAMEDLGVVGSTSVDYIHLTLDPADRLPVVLADTEGSTHPHALKRLADGTFTDLGALWGAGDAPLTAFTNDEGELAFFQFSSRCHHIRMEDILFRDVECLGWVIPDDQLEQGYFTMGEHWLALDADGHPVLAATDQSLGGVPVVFRIDSPGQWTSLGSPVGELPWDSRAELHLVTGPDGAATVMTLIPDLSDPVNQRMEATVQVHAGGTDWVDLGFTSPAGTVEHRLTASAAGLFVGFVFFADADEGTTQVAVARRASGRWQTLGPFSPAGEGAGQMRLIADDQGQVFLSYLTNDTPFSWMYMLAAWNGRWHQLGHALQGSLYEYLDNASMVPSPEGLPAFALLESSEYNLDLWVYLPNP
ncbi:MAG: hypothetical protein CVU59_09575 [Deltaproteobacteria bacterium HGW-Deltaproteobacteria-17]|nr:MAG: hypothetical protein CVU59_09575 [Deltaproteobacteria bacterium HGW-Deltaproteobacteria-17]